MEDIGSGIELGFYQLLSATGGFTLYAPDKMINYSKTPQSARYAFTFWAFPRNEWVRNLNDYVAFAEAYFKQHGFRCNMPLGSYFIRQDSSSLLSYTHDGDIISLDPIHAPGEIDKAAWAAFLQEFNEWSARARRPAAAEPEPLRQEGTRRRGLRRSLEDVVRLGAHGRSRPDGC